ncbi:MAG: haloalkane dehalogenase [Pseudomonadota bacterium]
MFPNTSLTRWTGALLVSCSLAAPLQASEASPLDPRISTEVTAASHFTTVKGASMHYVEAGSGDPILLLHGNPTSSYLWRNVIPFLEDQGRVIAPDLIGFGQSEKVEGAYDFQMHYDYLEGFIESLGLTNITLVVHDWGSALGLTYARLNEDKVKAVAFMEAIIPPAFPMPSLASFGPYEEIFTAMRTPGVGEELVLQQNVFIEQILPAAILRPLRPEEMEAYRAPFPTAESRVPVHVWPNQLPVAGAPAATSAVVTAIGSWLKESDLPKLVIYFEPGALLTPEAAKWMQQTYRNLEVRYGGAGIHYVQEDQPVAIGRHVSDWLAGLN